MMDAEKTHAALQELVIRFREDGMTDLEIADALFCWSVPIANGVLGEETVCRHLYLVAAHMRRDIDKRAADAMLERTLSGTTH